MKIALIAAALCALTLPAFAGEVTGAPHFSSWSDSCDTLTCCPPNCPAKYDVDYRSAFIVAQATPTDDDLKAAHESCQRYRNITNDGWQKGWERCAKVEDAYGASAAAMTEKQKRDADQGARDAAEAARQATHKKLLDRVVGPK